MATRSWSEFHWKEVMKTSRQFTVDSRQDKALSTAAVENTCYFFSLSTYSVSITSSSLSDGAAPGGGVSPEDEGPCPWEEALRYMASASLCAACCRRSAAWFMVSVPPASRAFFASATADSNWEISPGSSLPLFSANDFSEE